MRFNALVSVSLAFVSVFAVAGSFEPEPVDPNAEQILNKYIEAKQAQQDAMRGAEMRVDINARLLKLEKQGTLTALRSISKVGKITYKALGFSGDNTIKSEVITRYMAAETESRTRAITPANYKFKYKGQQEEDGRMVQVFQLAPKKKEVGLFHGELWLDSATGMPVREAGRFVKTPSVFLKKVDFVQEYAIKNGVAIPKHMQSTADVRIFGRAELSIDFSNFTRQESGEESPNGANR